MLQDLSDPARDVRLTGYRLALLVTGALLLAFSFVNYYAYDLARPWRELCATGDSTCGGGLMFARNAWYGFFGWFAVVLVLLATVSVMVPLRAGRQLRVLAVAVLALYALATVCLLLAIYFIPNAVGDAAVRRQADVDGGGSHYGDFFTNHHAWGFWASLAVVLAGLTCATLYLVAVRARPRE